MAERRPEGGCLGGDVRVRVQQGVPEGRLVARRQLALDLAPGRRRRELVELVEEARDLVRALGVEVDGVVRAVTHEEEAELLRRDDLGDRVRGRATALGRRHLLAADVEELVGDVERRLALEHLARDRVRPVARAAGRGQVLAARLDRHAEQRPLGGPLEVPRQLRGATEGRDPPVRAAALRPRDEVLPALEVDLLAVPVGHDRRADLAAGRADDADRVPRVGVLDVRDAAVDVADERRLVQRRADERIQVTGRVDVAHPVVAVRVDAEPRERVDERLGVVSGVGGVAVALLVRDVGERTAHLGLDRVRGQQGLGIHRVEVVDAVQERRLDPVRAEGPRDRVEDDRPAQAADVDGAGRRLGVVDDLRTGVADPLREFVSPIHRVSRLSR